MAIVLPFLLTSCGDDKDEPKKSLEEQLIGEWVWYAGDNNEYETHYIFDSDHTLISKVYLNGNIIDTSIGGWSLEGNILAYSFNNNGVTLNQRCQIIIEGDVMHLIYENTTTADFHRVKK
ncbi:MAG: hypothetical protein J6X22_10335 [Muribaculaceae bacterium]|nr:hypothetical protein [Muribaculaceae bacterium]